MGTQNMFEFMVAEGYPLCDVAVIRYKIAREPALAQKFLGGTVFVVPSYEPTASLAAPPRRSHRFFTKPDLLREFKFLGPLEAKKRLDLLFSRAAYEGTTYHFIMDPRYIRWFRYHLEEGAIAEIGDLLMGAT